jgi:hypothetical protein
MRVLFEQRKYEKSWDLDTMSVFYDFIFPVGTVTYARRTEYVHGLLNL